MNATENMEVPQYIPGNCMEIPAHIREMVMEQVANARCLNEPEKVSEKQEFEEALKARVGAFNGKNLTDIKATSKEIEELRCLVDDFNANHANVGCNKGEKVLLANSQFHFEVIPYGNKFYAYFAPVSIMFYQFSDSKNYKIEVVFHQPDVN